MGFWEFSSSVPCSEQGSLQNLGPCSLTSENLQGFNPIFRHLVFVRNNFHCEEYFPFVELEFFLLLIFLFQKYTTKCFNISEAFAGFFF